MKTGKTSLALVISEELQKENELRHQDTCFFVIGGPYGFSDMVYSKNKAKYHFR
jgi:23S rRNA pseudoU1915 N3-methylase RlmH